jgi:hypothetical protein
MTTPELYRALAEESEKREAAERQAEELRRELEELRSKLVAVTPAELLSVAAAARYINKSASYLHKDRLLRPCRIPYVQERRAGRVSYRRADLDVFITENRKGGKA